MKTDYTLVLTLTITGIPSEQEANYVRDHIILLAKMSSFDVSAQMAVITKVDEPAPSGVDD